MNKDMETFAPDLLTFHENIYPKINQCFHFSLSLFLSLLLTTYRTKEIAYIFFKTEAALIFTI